MKLGQSILGKTLFWIIFSGCITSQPIMEINNLNINEKDVSYFEHRVIKSYKRSKCANSIDEAMSFTIYTLNRTSDFSLKYLSNKDSVVLLDPLTRKSVNGDLFLDAYMCFYDKDNNILGSSNGLVFYCNKSNAGSFPSADKQIALKIKELKLTDIIQLPGVSISVYFGFDSDWSTYVMDLSTGILELKSLEEFILEEEK
jgi:hypothetical protein